MEARNTYPFTRAKRSVVLRKLITLRSTLSFGSYTPDLTTKVIENATNNAACTSQLYLRSQLHILPVVLNIACETVPCLICCRETKICWSCFNLCTTPCLILIKKCSYELIFHHSFLLHQP
jgi:hypothetical protein